MLKQFFASLLLIMGLGILLSGCQNTIQGVGKDMEHAGKQMQQP